jgi:hypothetical protein
MRMLANDGDGIGMPWVTEMRHDHAQFGKLRGNLVHDQWMRVPQWGGAHGRRTLVEQNRKVELLGFRKDAERVGTQRIEALVIRSGWTDMNPISLSGRLRTNSAVCWLTSPVHCTPAPSRPAGVSPPLKRMPNTHARSTGCMAAK